VIEKTRPPVNVFLMNVFSSHATSTKDRYRHRPLALGTCLPRWQTHIKTSSMSISHSTNNNQLALTESHWGRLVDQQASPLLKRIMGKIPAPDAFVVQLVCKLCMHSSRSALLRVVGQNHRGRGHQWLRFEWVRGWSDSRGLVYQRQPRWLLVWNMSVRCEDMLCSGKGRPL
jgi:hypothetical protein